MPLSNLNKGAILFAAIYIIIFLLSGLLAFSKPLLIQSNPAVANAVITAPTASRSSFNVGIMIIEILVISVIVLAEMRYRALSKLYRILTNQFKKYQFIIYTLEIVIAIGISIILLKISVFIFLFIIINGLGMFIVYRKLLKKANLKELIPVFITFLSFLILWPFVVLIIGSITLLLLFIEFAYFPVVFLISVLVMRHPTKNRINIIAFSFSVLLPPIIGTLFTPIYAVVLLAIFAIYDFIAVFLTKHMQFMAQKLLSMNVPEAFMIGDFDKIKERIASLG
ncbi:MAG: presenilin family intramembrane aspartyl protease, partial [Candidatus Parvarchaeum sp.]